MIIGPKEAARQLGCTRTRVQAACAGGMLRAQKRLGQWAIHQSDLDAVIADGGLRTGSATQYARGAVAVVESKIRTYLWSQVFSRTMDLRHASLLAQQLADETGVPHRVREIRDTTDGANGIMRTFLPGAAR